MKPRGILIERGPRRLGERDVDVRELERAWRASGSWEDLARYRRAMNRTGRAPKGEVFYAAIAKRAAILLRRADKAFTASVEHMRATYGKGEDDRLVPTARAYAKACRSAATLLSRGGKLPKRSMREPTGRDSQLRASPSYWKDYFYDASDMVNMAASLMREVAFDIERHDGKAAGAKAFKTVGWFVDLHSSMSATVDPHGGHYQNDKWKRKMPV